MLIKAIRRFREKTREAYIREEEKTMEPWKKRVMKIHEEASFLCYVDEMEPEPDSLLRFQIQGEIVKGTLEPGGELYLLDGEGRLLGKAVLSGGLEEKEENRMGLTRTKKNQFIIKMAQVGTEPAASMAVKSYQRQTADIAPKLSLLTDYIILDCGETKKETKEN